MHAHTYTNSSPKRSKQNSVQAFFFLLIIPYLFINTLVLQREANQYFENKGFYTQKQTKKRAWEIALLNKSFP